MAASFLDDRRLLRGPWQAFERDVARLLIGAGFDDVRIVGGSGDKGADIVGVKNDEIWVIQCKHTTTSPPTKSAVQEVVDAGVYYKADRLLVATSRPVGGSLLSEIERFKKVGIVVEILTPRSWNCSFRGYPNILSPGASSVRINKMHLKSFEVVFSIPAVRKSCWRPASAKPWSWLNSPQTSTETALFKAIASLFSPTSANS